MRWMALWLGAALLASGPACTKRQIAPAVVAGVGGGLALGGFIYSGVNSESGFFGNSTEDAATIGALVFGGVALLITGVVFSLTYIDCETDEDCWEGDACETSTGTCVARNTLPAVASEPEPVAPEPASPEPPAAEPASPEPPAAEPASAPSSPSVPAAPEAAPAVP